LVIVLYEKELNHVTRENTPCEKTGVPDRRG